MRVVVLVLLGLLLLVLARPDLAGLDADLPERDDLRLWIEAAGLLGPLLVVALMTLAIVASPLTRSCREKVVGLWQHMIEIIF
nr:hypothetical protein [Roseobacter litoralis]